MRRCPLPSSASAGRAGHTRPDVRTGGESLVADRAAAALTGSVSARGEPLEGAVDLRELTSGLIAERCELLALEGNRCTFRIMLIVEVAAGRGSHDCVQVSRQRLQPSLRCVAFCGERVPGPLIVHASNRRAICRLLSGCCPATCEAQVKVVTFP